MGTRISDTIDETKKMVGKIPSNVLIKLVRVAPFRSILIGSALGSAFLFNNIKLKKKSKKNKKIWLY